MWGRFGTTLAVVTLGLAASLVSYEAALASRSRDYSPSEFRALLRNFGYNVELGDNLTDSVSKKAIREFQERYKLKVDGTANPQTQDLAGELVMNLQSSLNLLVQPDPLLPRNQFYGIQTEAAIREFQKKFLLPETGIATLEVRQRVDQEAKKFLDQK
jgi:peptidoglycan hydrolase-like protein with peptidoglycan-binding domain